MMGCTWWVFTSVTLCQVCKLFRGKGLFLHICVVSSQPSQSLRLAVNGGSKGKNTLWLCGQRRLYGKGEN